MKNHFFTLVEHILLSFYVKIKENNLEIFPGNVSITKNRDFLEYKCIISQNKSSEQFVFQNYKTNGEKNSSVGGFW